MNFSRMWLALAAAAWFALPGLAAPAPAPTSGGPIAEALRLLGLLPRTAPLAVVPAVMGREGIIELEHRILQVVEVERTLTRAVTMKRLVDEVVQLPGGRTETRKREVTELAYEQVLVKVPVQVPGGKVEKMPVPVKSCKFFVVSKEGKLEALDAAKATALLKKRTLVLTGDNAEVDPRHLELVKPGTLYLVVPPPPPPARAPEPRDTEK